MAENLQRSAPIGTKDFWVEVVKGCVAGLSDKEMAEKLGMKLSSYETRKSNLCRYVYNGTSTFKIDGEEYVGQVCAEKFNIKLTELGNIQKFKEKTGKVIELVKPGFKLPNTRTMRSNNVDSNELKNMAASLFSESA